MKNKIIPALALSLLLGIGAGYLIWGGKTKAAPQNVSYGASYISVADGDEDVIILDGNVRKRLQLRHLQKNVSYVTDTATVAATQDQSVFVSSASSAILLTLPTAPSYSQCIDLYLDYTASNSIIISAAAVRDTITSDTVKTYCYDTTNSAWRSLSY